MIDILRTPDDVQILCEEENKDAVVSFEMVGRKLYVYLTANESQPKYICMRWNYRTKEPVKIMGDKWERAYADLGWHSLNGEDFMPWYFLATKEDETVGCGVMVQPNSLVCFQYDSSGVTAWFDVRSGGMGVQLNGRKLLVGIIVCEHYVGMSAFAAAKEFCKVMCPNPILPKTPVYGSNNWYYAYGECSYDTLMSDARLLAELTEGIQNRPYMVVDGGWTNDRFSGPWLPNDKFCDMKKLADEFKNLDLKPGIWIRPLRDDSLSKEHPECTFQKNKADTEEHYLDPSHPIVKDYVRNVILRLKDWGYQLVKHDFSTYDFFEGWGWHLNGKLNVQDGWSCHDRTKTTAEVILDFYRLIRESAGDMIVIGCNTIPHLCAGIFELNRTGDDTSGVTWSRTRANGVNTMAFRLCQNKTFYMADADCVGILDKNIDWKLNRKWLDLVSRSGSPLFVSMKPTSVTDEMKEDLKKAFYINSIQEDEAEPLDWLYNNIPAEWLINGEEVEYDWVMDSYPALLYENKVQPV